MTAPRLTAEQDFATDARTAALCDGDKYLIQGGYYGRYGGRFVTIRAWAGLIPNPMYQPTP